MTQAEQHDGQTSFHAVPNRWLVTRRRDNTLEEQWIVESDFLSDDNAGGIGYPYILEQMTGVPPRPFRYLGRKLPLSAWSPSGDRSEYLAKLTAVGYGEPTFAAFYPNCHSVFGFHDPDYADGIPAGLRYEVIGWYSDSGQDALSILLGSLSGKVLWQDAIRLWDGRRVNRTRRRIVWCATARSRSLQNAVTTRCSCRPSASRACRNRDGPHSALRRFWSKKSAIIPSISSRSGFIDPPVGLRVCPPFFTITKFTGTPTTFSRSYNSWD